MFYFGIELFHKKEVWIVFKGLITWVGAGAVRVWKIIFEIAWLLKTTIRRSIVRFQNDQSFNTLCTSETILRKLHYSSLLLLYEKQVPKSLIVSFHRSMHLISETVVWTHFRTATLSISHFVWFGFSPQKREKLLNISS